MNGGSVKPTEVVRRKDTEINIRREACLDVAERLFTAKGIDATSMQDIAAEVGVSVGTLYNMFESKMEIAHQVFLRNTKAEHEWAESIANDVSISFRDALTMFVEKAIKTMREHQIIMRTTIQSLTLPLASHKEALKDIEWHHRTMLGFLGRIVERGIKEGIIRPDVPIGRITAGMVGAMMGLFFHMIYYEGGIPEDLTASRIYELLLSGIGRRTENA